MLLRTRQHRPRQRSNRTGKRKLRSTKAISAGNIYIERRITIRTANISMEHEGQLHDDVGSIAKQRVQTLFSLAQETFDKDPLLAQRYIDIARRVAMAAKIRLPRQYRSQICRHCKSFILPGGNCRVRVRQRREPHVTITCLRCGKHTRIPLAKKDTRTSIKTEA